ncbi:MAG: nucleoside triphosphate pyrophosphohydrolase [Clostridia bacterium]|nr:nucleoside triphosphate pyrophosphohydrolase [Clostridia bacterium]
MEDKEKAAILADKEHDFNTLRRIMACLRGEHGCPWDRAQDHKSIRRDLIEETYEVAEAIDNEDPDLLREELGDLLLQVVFHARMEEEAGRFSMDDVIADLCEKLIRRHPHVFGDVSAEDPEGALASWNEAKKEEKHRDGAKGNMEAIPPSLPALMRARKTAKVALKDGYSFGTADEMIDRITAELNGLKGKRLDDREEAVGALSDAIFSISALFAVLGEDPEENLNKKTAGFIDSYTNL